MRFLFLLLMVLGGMPLFAFDWGGSVENSFSTLQATAGASSSSITESPTLRMWVNWAFSRSTSLLLKGNISNNYNQSYGPGSPTTNVFSADVDYFVWTSDNLWVGRTDFRDFGGTVLNTKLDGVQYVFSLPNLDVKAALGTSAALFKSGSTIIISQADLNDRITPEDFTKPNTLWASPRLVANLEASARQIVPDQTLHVGLIGQYDLRPGQQTDGSKHDPTNQSEAGAPVSMGYFGLGGEGRIVGPFYWNAWSYLGAGATLTPIGQYTPAKTGVGATPAVLQTWRNTLILNGLGSLDLTLLLPDLRNLVFDLGVQVGSWDYDGASPDQNLPDKGNPNSPSMYTGWVGISRTGGALIFNPQPANMVITQLLVSVKPVESFQIVSSTFISARAIVAPIAETGLDPRSSELYLGTEQDFSALWRPTSDLGLTFGLGFFAPNTSAMTRSLEVKLSSGLNLSF